MCLLIKSHLFVNSPANLRVNCIVGTFRQPPQHFLSFDLLWTEDDHSPGAGTRVGDTADSKCRSNSFVLTKYSTISTCCNDVLLIFRFWQQCCTHAPGKLQWIKLHDFLFFILFLEHNQFCVQNTLCTISQIVQIKPHLNIALYLMVLWNWVHCKDYSMAKNRMQMQINCKGKYLSRSRHTPWLTPPQQPSSGHCLWSGCNYRHQSP